MDVEIRREYAERMAEEGPGEDDLGAAGARYVSQYTSSTYDRIGYLGSQSVTCLLL
jgi:hypothetical protein